MRSFWFGSLAAFLLPACVEGSGTLSVKLTDTPPDLSKLAAVEVAISKVDVHVVASDPGDGGDPQGKSIDSDESWQVVNPTPLVFDLLKLQNDVTAPVGNITLPPTRKITQFRFFIDSAGRNVVTLAGGRSCAMDLGGVDPTGVRISNPFEVIEIKSAVTTEVVIDFDLKDSVSEEGDCTFVLRPVIKLTKTPVDRPQTQ